MTRITGHVEGDDRVIQHLSEFPPTAKENLKKNIYKMALILQRHIVTDKLSGQVLNRKTGTLARSIQTKMEVGSDYVYGIVGSRVNESNRLVYAAIHEFGGTIPAHDVVAKGGALKFELKNGVTMFRRRVHIPDVKMPERSYVRSSMNDLRDEILLSMKSAVADAAKKTRG